MKRTTCLWIIAVATLTVLLVVCFTFLMLKLEETQSDQKGNTTSTSCGISNCSRTCRVTIVESIPENLTYAAGAPTFPSTYEGWSDLMNKSTSSIYIASYYWTLRGSDSYSDPSDYQGESIYKQLFQTSERNITLRIAQNIPDSSFPDNETAELAKNANTEVRSLNFTHLLGSGILHTKFWIVDQKHIYIGSANMDWRSLTQVKELGAIVHDCPCMANDLMKVFDVYWDLGKTSATVPSSWPESYATQYNLRCPMNTGFGKAFISSAPPSFSPVGRTNDDDAIVTLMNEADRFVYVAVMDYLPLRIYTYPNTFWSKIDDAIRASTINHRITVRLLMSKWNHTSTAQFYYLQSLADITSSYTNVTVEVKIFVVPASSEQAEIPYSRVNHNKYMVTDKAAYFGTSNWSGDYFTDTAGVGLIIHPQQNASSTSNSTVRDQLESIFLRDWNSTYAKPLSEITW